MRRANPSYAGDLPKGDGRAMADRPWRLIIDGPAGGAWNMAVDRALQVTRERGTSPPTLRIYRWERPTVTLGAFQPATAVDPCACLTYGVDVVRRATGGRGVLHDDEITYSVVAATADGMPRGVVASYRHLCAGLIAAFQALDVPAELTSRDRGPSASPACYLHATSADVSVGALKLSGSAQVWKGDTVLQHGSFTRTRDVAREQAVFSLTAEESAALDATTTTISALTGHPVELDAIGEAVVRGFAEGLGISLEPADLTDEERALAMLGLDDARIVLVS